MSTVQTYLSRREYEKLKKYMEKHGLKTVHKAAAELIRKGLKDGERVEEGAIRPVEGDEREDEPVGEESGKPEQGSDWRNDWR